MKNVEIKNWNDLKDQFGFKKHGSLKSAVDISRELGQKAKCNSFPVHVFVDCNESSEAICCFRKVSETGSVANYEYQGTAN